MGPDNPASGTILTVEVSTDTVEDVNASLPDLRTFGKRLRYARKLRKIGSNELSRTLGMSEGYISSLETRRSNPPSGEAIAVASKLGVRVEWLVSNDGPMEPHRSGPRHAVFGMELSAKPNLEEVLREMNKRGRWKPTTVVAGFGLPADLSVAVWPDTLDRIEKALDPVLRRLDR
jgi:transcriptional regulator with XRE-family HTH domain